MQVIIIYLSWNLPATNWRAVIRISVVCLLTLWKNMYANPRMHATASAISPSMIIACVALNQPRIKTFKHLKEKFWWKITDKYIFPPKSEWHTLLKLYYSELEIDQGKQDSQNAHSFHVSLPTFRFFKENRTYCHPHNDFPFHICTSPTIQYVHHYWRSNLVLQIRSRTRQVQLKSAKRWRQLIQPNLCGELRRYSLWLESQLLAYWLLGFLIF